jgi:DhnA family fructose-bisphosphate aldolase class Ia
MMSRDIAPEAQIGSLAGPLAVPDDLDPLVRRAAANRFVCIGEASHGTHEYYRWRALLSRRLIEEHGFTWIGVEGDWPDCWRINRWVRGHADQDMTATQVLAGFERWPTWMWANDDVADFLSWLHAHNLARPESQRVGFYGLDVYSLWDSLWQIMTWLESNAPHAVPAAMTAWQCFLPYGEDPHQYAQSTRLVPTSCEPEVVALLVQIRAQTRERMGWDENAFDAAQNAEVAANAEHYYRTMVRGDRQSWNIRDHHMSAQRLGMPLIVWAYPRREAIEAKGGRDSFYAVDYAARVASELGADVVKVNFPHPDKIDGVPEVYRASFSAQAAIDAVVRSANNTLVLVSGGSRQGDEAMLEKATRSMDAGATGLIFGRNVWQRPHEESLQFVDQLRKILAQHARAR